MIYHGDCLDVMQTFEENSLDAVVTDPPYGLSFMGKEWDHGIPGIPFWEETLRVCKPGAHMCAFGGTRTHHRLMVAIEDAGWEIRDCLMWVYGSGFPKSLDISKAIDKAAGAEREVIGKSIRGSGLQPNKINNHGKGDTGIGYADGSGKEFFITAPVTPAAIQWNGWGTALKPAWEPIILCRKPLEGTVAANVQKWGTGGLNIDACRVEFVDNNDKKKSEVGFKTGWSSDGSNEGWSRKSHETYKIMPPSDKGRFPANLIHDGSDEILQLFPNNEKPSGKASGETLGKLGTQGRYGTAKGENMDEPAFYGDIGSAARFFYTAKADSAERNKYLKGLPQKKVNDGRETPIDNAFQRGETLRKNTHPTVKPVDLLRYLCRLITPPGGIILDPFAGSGSTGVAAFEEGFDSILIEIDEEYYRIAKIRNAQTRIGGLQ